MPASESGLLPTNTQALVEQCLMRLRCVGDEIRVLVPSWLEVRFDWLNTKQWFWTDGESDRLGKEYQKMWDTALKVFEREDTRVVDTKGLEMSGQIWLVQVGADVKKTQ